MYMAMAAPAWNVAGIVVLAIAAISARSVSLTGFALDSLIEIGASTVVIWELSGTGEARQRRALRLIGYAFAILALYLLIQSSWALISGHRAAHSPVGIIWTAITAMVMFGLAAGKSRVGKALGNPVLRTEARLLRRPGSPRQQPFPLATIACLAAAEPGCALFHDRGGFRGGEHPQPSVIMNAARRWRYLRQRNVSFPT